MRGVTPNTLTALAGPDDPVIPGTTFPRLSATGDSAPLAFEHYKDHLW
jgi:hypothetical protein